MRSPLTQLQALVANDSADDLLQKLSPPPAQPATSRGQRGAEKNRPDNSEQSEDISETSVSSCNTMTLSSSIELLKTMEQSDFSDDPNISSSDD
jgi:hypothetical protein